MLRTKLSHVNEGGVAAGLGALDSVLLIYNIFTRIYFIFKFSKILYLRSFWLMPQDAAKFQKAAAKMTVVFVVKKTNKKNIYNV